ncbi:LOW QUALITY PROTEIN: hypothetical protein TorRG33x02_069330 [Trema orientale]|uniref:Uncharacterized protein n=1 Tax=Trema orientale TaxID=63057 RepID=A0A2P5FHA3_TREOI|nr:LOW QUALITY PROTEIN: hypothetical protein TorRG33x02_069330 [Trema orientale]
MAPQLHAGLTHLLAVVLSTQMPLVSLKVRLIQSLTLCSGEMTIPLFRLASYLLCTLMSTDFVCVVQTIRLSFLHLLCTLMSTDYVRKM